MSIPWLTINSDFDQVNASWLGGKANVCAVNNLSFRVVLDFFDLYRNILQSSWVDILFAQKTKNIPKA